MPRHRYGIALGSNLGDRLDNLGRARLALEEHGKVVTAASVYRSAPVDCAEGDPFFLNTVLELEIDLEPLELLALTQSIETKLGRGKKPHHNAPREIDIDLLYQVGAAPLDLPQLQIPHPRLAERRFVLEPLAEIRPEFELGKKSVARLLAALQSDEPPLVMVIPSSNPEKLDRLAELQSAGQQIVAITAYDYPTARLMDEAGVDLILVGDSLGMVVLGHEDTTNVTLDMMVHHTEAVRRGTKDAILIADLPIGTYDSPAEAVESAKQLTAAGADVVKLEGGVRQAEKVAAIIESGIRVIGHIGMLPQRVREEGGYRKKGKTDEDLKRIIKGALALEEAGVDAIIIESTAPAAARKTCEAVKVPVIGIGAGKSCDGQIRVVHDVLGSFPWFVPKFARTHANLAEETSRAARSYIEAVRTKQDA